jgi:hypothetical protein
MVKQGKRKREGIRKSRKEPVDYGVTKGQFYEILDKASQPTKNGEQTQNNEAKEKY